MLADVKIAALLLTLLSSGGFSFPDLGIQSNTETNVTTVSNSSSNNSLKGSDGKGREKGIGRIDGRASDRLKEHLIRRNGKFVTTLSDQRRIEVGLEVYLPFLISLDAKRGLLTATSILSIRWRLQSLSWDPSDFGNMTDIEMPNNEIWIPDLVLLSASGEQAMRLVQESGIRLKVRKDGVAHLVVRTDIQTACTPTPDNFPFDVHKCVLVFGSMDRDVTEIDVFADDADVRRIVRQQLDCHRSELEVPAGFEILHSKSVRETVVVKSGSTGNRTFSQLIHRLTIKRRPDGSYDLFIQPILCLLVLSSLLVFCLPPKSLSLRLTVIAGSISTSLLAVIASADVIGFSSVSVFQSFCLMIVYLNCGSIVICLLVFLSASRVYSSALNIRLASCVNGLMGKALLLEATAISFDVRTEMEKRVEGGSGPLAIVLQEEWVLLTALVDRIILIVYVSIISVLFPSFK